MPFLIQYIIKLSISIPVIYLFYRFILRPLTFYTWNRWYLLGYSLLAFVIPFININPVLDSMSHEQAVVINFIPVINPAEIEAENWFTMTNRWNVIIMAFIGGMVVMMIRLFIQFLSYQKLKRASTLLSESPVRIFQVDREIIPFSFGNAIFINAAQHNEQELHDIINHEFVHVRQKHTVDMIWAELLCILNWYNPFAWLMKKVICQNLEFIADEQVLKSGLDKKVYQYLLLKVAGGASFRIANQFNFSFLRKRILMMNKIKSAKFHLVKFLFVLPLLAVLLLSFREKIEVILDLHNDKFGIVEKRNLLTNVNQGSTLIADTVPINEGKEKSKGKPSIIGILWKDSTRLKLDNNSHQPLFIVDEIVRDRHFVEALDPASIERMDVLKDKQAQQYGEKGQNGVVRIYTRQIIELAVKKPTIEISVTAKNQVRVQNNVDSVVIEADSVIINEKPIIYFSGQDSAYLNDFSGRKEADAQIRLRGITDPEHDVLFVVDGVRYNKSAALKNLAPDDIKTISILKDAEAIAYFGNEAKNGVIIVTTKSATAKKKRVDEIEKLIIPVKDKTKSIDSLPAKN